MNRRFVIDSSLAGPLITALEALEPNGPTALDEGRVFVNRRRASALTQVAEGDVVELETRRQRPGAVEIVTESAGAIVAAKPAGIPTEPDRRGNRSLLTEAAKLLGRPVSSLHAVTRLDLEVSGLVLLAGDRDARRRLAQAHAAGRIHRAYVGITLGEPAEPHGRWESPIPSSRRRTGRSPAQLAAATRFNAVCRAAAVLTAPPFEPPFPTAMIFHPETGRMHQIRIHCAGAGVPLVGDTRYGGPRRVTALDGSVIGIPRLALHAHCVKIEGLHAAAPEPLDLQALWERLGGRRGDFADALARTAYP